MGSRTIIEFVDSSNKTLPQIHMSRNITPLAAAGIRRLLLDDLASGDKSVLRLS